MPEIGYGGYPWLMDRLKRDPSNAWEVIRALIIISENFTVLEEAYALIRVIMSRTEERVKQVLEGTGYEEVVSKAVKETIGNVYVQGLERLVKDVNDTLARFFKEAPFVLDYRYVTKKKENLQGRLQVISVTHEWGEARRFVHNSIIRELVLGGFRYAARQYRRGRT